MSQRSILRLFLVTPMAVLVTVGIFFMMSGMINSEAIINSDPPPPIDDFIMAERTTVDPISAEELTPPELPPPPPVDPATTDPSPRPTPVYDPPQPPSTSGTTPVIILPTVEDAIIKPQPTYPSACQSRGLEGYAIVEFDVTANGQVVNARIFDVSDRCFERAALNAIRSWKYQPSENGSSRIVRSGLRKKFVFRLTG